MITKIKQFFNTRVTDTNADQTSVRQQQIQLAAAALMVEIMVTDGLVSPDEETVIMTLLESSFALSRNEAEELFELARQEVTEASSLFQFTTLVNEHFSADEKFTLLTQAWKVALADGLIDKYEENLIRRLADLLHIGHSQFIRAKIQARDVK